MDKDNITCTSRNTSTPAHSNGRENGAIGYTKPGHQPGCPGGAVAVAGGTTHYYYCTACDQPVDPREMRLSKPRPADSDSRRIEQLQRDVSRLYSALVELHDVATDAQTLLLDNIGREQILEFIAYCCDTGQGETDEVSQFLDRLPGVTSWAWSVLYGSNKVEVKQ